jgi:hypothetical protein
MNLIGISVPARLVDTRFDETVEAMEARTIAIACASPFATNKAVIVNQ